VNTRPFLVSNTYVYQKIKLNQMRILFVLLFTTINYLLIAQSPSDIENHLILGSIEKGMENNLTIYEQMEAAYVQGVSVAVVRDGKIEWTRAYGITNKKTKAPVNDETLFQAASISKPVAAVGVLKLVEQGKIDLDEDVNTYLKTWKIPESAYTKDEKVTLRRILSHTAGLNVHGFPGYRQDEKMRSVQEVLSGKGNTSAVVVTQKPGKEWRYSGGGYEIMELLIEDVTGQRFVDYMQSEVLTPMGMSNSTYVQPLPDDLHKNASAAFSMNGSMPKGLWNNYPEHAAAGLWTTPTDLAKFTIEIFKIRKGKKDGVLSPDMVNKMLEKGMGDWGLGFARSADNGVETFGHGGKNLGFTNDYLALMDKDDAIIVLTNSDRGSDVIRPMIRAVSKAYNWNIYQPVEFVRKEVSPKELKTYNGEYVFFAPEQGFGQYSVNCKAKKGEMACTDPRNRTEYLIPTEGGDFIDKKSGMLFEFKEIDGQMNLIFPGNQTFIRKN